MELLKQRIQAEGKVLPGNVVKVDGFLNHRVDTALLREIAREFRKRLDTERATVVLTAEASGIALATVCAEELGIPMIFAKKAKSDNIEGGLYQTATYCYAPNNHNALICAKEFITKDDRVLIVDDFLSGTQEIRGLIGIVEQAGAVLAGIGVAVEKGFHGGGDQLRSEGYPLNSLVIIDKATDDGFIFRE
jgi:xanthine phosphoribosyltransferase